MDVKADRTQMLIELCAHVDGLDASDQQKEVSKTAFMWIKDEELSTLYQLFLKAKFRDALSSFISSYAVET